MKLYEVSGVIRCGHRTYTITKAIIADSTEQVIEMYRQEHPHAKMINPHFEYEVQESRPRIVFTNYRKHT